MSKKSNAVDEVKDRIAELTIKKREELARIQEKHAAAYNRLEAADMAIKDATENTDEAAYRKAKDARQEALSAIEMYDKRAEQISNRELVTEEESDAVIDKLLAYEDELAAAFADAIAEPLSKLADLYDDYINEVRRTENTMRAWTANIHAYYRNTCVMKKDADGNVTNRMETPQPIRAVAYTGGTVANLVRDVVRGRLAAYIRKDRPHA